MSATAALSAATVADVIPVGDNRFAAFTAALALTTGIAALLAGILRLGFLASFISEPVIKGFIVGLALTIIIGQVPKLFGIEKAEGDFFEQAWGVLSGLGDTDTLTLAVGVASLVVVLGLKRVAPGRPGFARGRADRDRRRGAARSRRRHRRPHRRWAAVVRAAGGRRLRRARGGRRRRDARRVRRRARRREDLRGARALRDRRQPRAARPRRREPRRRPLAGDGRQRLALQDRGQRLGGRALAALRARRGRADDRHAAAAHRRCSSRCRRRRWPRS